MRGADCWVGTTRTPWAGACIAPEEDARTAVDAEESALAGPAVAPLDGCGLERTLRAFRDPATGRSIFEVTRVAESQRARLGDLFLSHRHAHECRAGAAADDAEVVEVAEGARTSRRPGRQRGRDRGGGWPTPTATRRSWTWDQAQ